MLKTVKKKNNYVVINNKNLIFKKYNLQFTIIFFEINLLKIIDYFIILNNNRKNS